MAVWSLLVQLKSSYFPSTMLIIGKISGYSGGSRFIRHGIHIIFDLGTVGLLCPHPGFETSGWQGLNSRSVQLEGMGMYCHWGRCWSRVLRSQRSCWKRQRSYWLVGVPVWRGDTQSIVWLGLLKEFAWIRVLGEEISLLRGLRL
jgi:hypothetical protein